MATVVIPYSPREVFKPFHNRTERFAIGVAHRRCGKTVACINDLVRRAIISDKPMYRAAYIAPYLKQAKDVAWEYLKLYSRPIWGAPPNESELYCTLLGGQRARIYGADNADALRGGYLDDVILDEYADMAPSVWGSIIRPMLADRKGSATFIGTPKGRNSFHELYERAANEPDWFRFMLRASDTKLLAESELAAARQDMTPEQFDQEFQCSFDAAIMGAYFGKDIAEAERAGRIIAVEPIEGKPVHTAWDLGMGDSTAIWFWQAANNEIRVIDHYENHGQAIPHYVAEIESRGYKKGTDYVPHDAKVRSLETGRTRIETLVSLGRNPKLVANHKIMDGINAARLTMPRVWFDSDKCKLGIEALRQYRADFDEKTRAFKDAPKHDWCFTADTKILTRYGTYRIKELPTRGEVLTPCGWKPYHSPRLTRTNARVVAVRFADGLTVRCTPDHMFMTASGWKSAGCLTKGTLIQSSLTYSRSISMAAFIAFGRATTTIRGAVRSFIAMLGREHSARYLAVATSTTGTAILPTTSLQTWSAWTRSTIFRFHGKTPEQSVRRLGTSPRMLATPLLNGINRMLDAFGTGGTLLEPKVGLNGSVKTAPATSVEKYLRHWSAKAVIAKGFAALIARPLIIDGVDMLSSSEDVYCITVPGEESFSLANGAVVHNCSHTADAFRYLCMAWREEAKPVDAPSIPPVKAITDYKVEEMWNFQKPVRDRV